MRNGKLLRMKCIVDGAKGRQADSIHAGLEGPHCLEMAIDDKIRAIQM